MRNVRNVTENDSAKDTENYSDCGIRVDTDNDDERSNASYNL